MLKYVFPVISEQLKTCKVDLKHANRKEVIVFGDSTYRQSLLFQAAVSIAATNEEVLFITREELKVLPLPVHNAPTLNATNSELINLTYIASHLQLVDFLSSVHNDESDKHYGAIVVDDIHYYLDKEEHHDSDMTFAKLLALIRDVGHYFSSLHESNNCKVIIGSSDNIIYHQIAHQFFRNIWLLNERTKNEFRLQVLVDRKVTCVADYAKEQCHLVLNSVHS